MNKGGVGALAPRNTAADRSQEMKNVQEAFCSQVDSTSVVRIASRASVLRDTPHSTHETGATNCCIQKTEERQQMKNVQEAFCSQVDSTSVVRIVFNEHGNDPMFGFRVRVRG